RRVDQHVPINSNNDKRRNEREKDRTCEKECKEAGEKEGEEALNSLLHSGTDRQKLRFWLDGLKGGRHGSIEVGGDSSVHYEVNMRRATRANGHPNVPQGPGWGAQPFR